jgi:sugar-specific transcriptional regulator TrmB
MSEEIATTLRDIGLTKYQSLAYVAVVRLGGTQFTTLAEEAGIPQQRIYDVVDDLQAMGLVEVHEGSRGKKAVPVPPEVALEELKQQEINQVESHFDTAIDDLDSLSSEVQRTSGYVTVVNHESSMRRHISNAIESANWWLFLSLPASWYDDFKEDVRDAIDRGVTVRLLVHTDDVARVENTAYDPGIPVRCRPSADTIVAADRKYGVFRGLSAPAVARPSLVTKDESIVEMFQRYSEQFWTGSRHVQFDHPYPRRYLTPWRAIIDHRDALESNVTFEVCVEGNDTETGRLGTWVGPIVDYKFESEREADYSVVLPEVARLVIETDDGPVTVGGWDATLEDVAAHGLEIRKG